MAMKSEEEERQLETLLCDEERERKWTVEREKKKRHKHLKENSNSIICRKLI